MYNGNNVEFDDGVECTSPYHNSSTCNKCIYDTHINTVRKEFRREYEEIEDFTYEEPEDKINALYQLEDMFPELNINMDKIINQGVSYLEF